MSARKPGRPRRTKTAAELAAELRDRVNTLEEQRRRIEAELVLLAETVGRLDGRPRDGASIRACYRARRELERKR